MKILSIVLEGHTNDILKKFKLVDRLKTFSLYFQKAEKLSVQSIWYNIKTNYLIQFFIESDTFLI